jgi:S-formylglutathione hydrolase FrmB
MSSRNTGRTPVKLIILYLLVLCFVSIHEMGRIVDWVDRLCLDNDCPPAIANTVHTARTMADDWGVARLVKAEKDLLAFAADLPDVGAYKIIIPEPALVESVPTTPPPEPVQPPVAQESPKPAAEESGVFNRSQYMAAVDGAAGMVGQLDHAVAATPQTSAPPEPPAEPPAPRKLRPKTVLIAGDSMILEGFGVALQRELQKRKHLKVYREGKYSSGLSRPDYFNWMPYLKELLAKHKPDLLVISLGANDGQDIVDAKGKRHFVATESWNEIYGSRVTELLELAKDKGVFVFWVGLPIMGPTGYNKRIANLNQVAESACQKASNCEFVDVWLTLADDKDNYTTFMKTAAGRHIRIRAKDRIHLTTAGGQVMVKYFLERTEPLVDLSEPKKDQPKTAQIDESIKAAFTEDGALREPAKAVSVRLMELDSKARGKKTLYYAFVPDAPNGPAPYGVLYLLHGAWDSYKVFHDRTGGLIKDLVKKYGLIVITPDGDPFGWYADSPFDPANQIETYFMKELMGHVESNFPVDPQRRGIAGLSMGGHGAFILSLRHPGTFRSVSSMSGVLDITRHHGQWELNRVFGPFNTDNLETWRRHSAFFLALDQRDYLKKVPALVTVGASDPWVLLDNRVFHKKLDELKVGHTYEETKGTHDWTYWTSQIPRHLAFHARHLNVGP